MADFYKILKADPLGEPYTPNMPNAKPIQSYWCQVEGQEKAVMIGKQVGNDLYPGQHVYGDLTYAKSQKGNEYWKFRSAKIPEGVQRPADSPTQATAQAAIGVSTTGASNVSDTVPGWFQVYGNMIEFIYKEMRAISETPNHNAGETPKEEAPEKEEPKESVLDETTQETLNAIFGEVEEV